MIRAIWECSCDQRVMRSRLENYVGGKILSRLPRDTREEAKYITVAGLNRAFCYEPRGQPASLPPVSGPNFWNFAPTPGVRNTTSRSQISRHGADVAIFSFRPINQPPPSPRGGVHGGRKAQKAGTSINPREYSILGAIFPVREISVVGNRGNGRRIVAFGSFVEPIAGRSA